jgi:hypothetical protein
LSNDRRRREVEIEFGLGDALVELPIDVFEFAVARFAMMVEIPS